MEPENTRGVGAKFPVDSVSDNVSFVSTSLWVWVVQLYCIIGNVLIVCINLSLLADNNVLFPATYFSNTSKLTNVSNSSIVCCGEPTCVGLNPNLLNSNPGRSVDRICITRRCKAGSL